MTTTAQKKLDKLMRAHGARAVAEQARTNEKTLRALRAGAMPRAATKTRLTALGITQADWVVDAPPTPADDAIDLDALEAGEIPDDADDLLARLVVLYSDAARAISERIRAASIALSLAKRMPARSGLARLENFARDLCAVDPGLRRVCERHIEDALATPENPAGAILSWARSVARERDMPDRVVTLACSLEARAAKVCSELDTTGSDKLGALAAELVRARTPVRGEIAAVLTRHGQEARPLAPAHFNVSGHGYLRMCDEHGWRPRERNAGWTLGPDGLLRVEDLP